jgi:hypothetical protein
MPKGHDPDYETGGSITHNIKWPLLIKDEVERAIFRSNPDKAPGLDEISFRV